MSNAAALRIFVKSPVSQGMIAYLVSQTLKVLNVPKHENTSYPSPPSSPNNVKGQRQLPSLMTFINRLVRYTNVYPSTLMSSLVYLERLQAKLPSDAQGMPCTLHRIFLACLILAAKNLNDSSPKNKHWAGYTDGLFTTEDVNLMERQLLFLLDWNLRITEQDLYKSLRPFLEPIKHDIKSSSQIRRDLSCNSQKQRNRLCSIIVNPTSPVRVGHKRHNHNHNRSIDEKDNTLTQGPQQLLVSPISYTNKNVTRSINHKTSSSLDSPTYQLIRDMSESSLDSSYPPSLVNSGSENSLSSSSSYDTLNSQNNITIPESISYKGLPTKLSTYISNNNSYAPLPTLDPYSLKELEIDNMMSRYSYQATSVFNQSY